MLTTDYSLHVFMFGIEKCEYMAFYCFQWILLSLTLLYINYLLAERNAWIDNLGEVLNEFLFQEGMDHSYTSTRKITCGNPDATMGLCPWVMGVPPTTHLLWQR